MRYKLTTDPVIEFTAVSVKMYISDGILYLEITMINTALVMELFNSNANLYEDVNLYEWDGLDDDRPWKLIYDGGDLLEEYFEIGGNHD